MASALPPATVGQCWLCFPGWGQSENIVTPFGEKAGIVPVVRPLANFLLPDFFRFTELRFGYRVKKAFMLVAGLFSSNT